MADCPGMSVGQVAALLRVPVHRVLYVVRTRGVAPVGRVGIARVFAAADVERIRAELQRIAASKGVTLA